MQIQRIVCLRGTVWSEDAARFTWLLDLCDASLSRLVSLADEDTS
jgi:hypothetical protein